MLRSNDVHCTPVILPTPEETPTHRLGTYYLEAGYGIRSSKVTYDRKHSAITEYDLSKVDSGLCWKASPSISWTVWAATPSLPA